MELRDHNQTNDIYLAKRLPSECTTEPQTINFLTKSLFFLYFVPVGRSNRLGPNYSGLIWPDESQSGRGDGRQQQLRGSTQRLFPANVLPADQDGTPPVQLPPSVKPHGESAGAKPCKMAPNERTDAVLTLTNLPGNLSRQNISRCLCSSLGLDC